MSAHAREPDDPKPPPWLAELLDEAAPRPGEALRDDLRRRLTGASSVEAPASAAPAPLRARPRSRRAGAASRATRRTALWSGAALVAVAAGVLAFVFAGRLAPSSPRLEFVECDRAELRIAGAEHAEDEFERLLLAGAEFESGAREVRVRLDGVALLEFAPNTRASLSPWASDGAGEAVLTLRAGGVRVATAPDFAPRGLRVDAPDAQIAVVGTEFGVDVLDGVGTCVCCTHGVVAVRPRGAAPEERVTAGSMSFCFASDEPPMLGEAKPDHVAEVTALRRFAWPAK